VTGTSVAIVVPSTTIGAFATPLATSLVRITSNRRVSACRTSFITSLTRTCTRVDSGGRCSPSSSFGL
jgi:hypothetical protein